jgi:hypothetical protein
MVIKRGQEKEKPLPARRGVHEVAASPPKSSLTKNDGERCADDREPQRDVCRQKKAKKRARNDGGEVSGEAGFFMPLR